MCNSKATAETQQSSNPTFSEATRKKWEDELRAQHGDAWMEQHKKMLDDQWAYINETF